jgi:hypothetical protein
MGQEDNFRRSKKFFVKLRAVFFKSKSLNGAQIWSGLMKNTSHVDHIDFSMILSCKPTVLIFQNDLFSPHEKVTQKMGNISATAEAMVRSSPQKCWHPRKV